MFQLRKGEYFEESKLIGVFNTQKECLEKIEKSEGSKSPYFRIWENGKEVLSVDFGSYSIFYYIVDVDK